MASVAQQLSNDPSKRFAAFAAAFCVGAAAGPLARSVGMDALLFGTLGLIVLATLAPGRYRLFAVIAMLAALGAFRYAQAFAPPHIPTAASAAGDSVRVEGVVRGEVERRVGFARATVGEVAIASRPVHGRVLARLPETTRVAHGDRLAFTCRLREPEPFNGFAYDRCLHAKDIYAICFRPENLVRTPADAPSAIGAVLGLKRRVIGALASVVPEPHAGFLSGLLFGGSSSLSDGLRDAFSRTGASHILAASGFNVSLFTLVFLGFARETRLGRRGAIAAAAVLLGAYIISAGATPSVLRAAFMASLVLVAGWGRRIPHIPNLLLAALAILLLANPRWLYDDVGFQLSFVATAAVLTLPPLIERYAAFLPKRYGIRESATGSVAAIALTLPIILWHFGEISLVAPLVNLLVLPLVIPAMAATGIAIAGHALMPVIDAYVAAPAWGFSTIILHIIRWFSALPVLALPGGAARTLAVGLTGIYALLWLYGRRAARASA